MALTQVKTTGLADDAVTGAKIADDTVAEANMANDAISLAELKAGTDGQVITYDASGNPTAVGPGTDGQVLTSTGAGSPPAFEALPASNNYTHPNHSGDVTSSADGATTIADNAVTLAKMAGLARGKLIYGDSSGDPAALTVGSANQVLTSDGTDVAWAAAAAGGLTEADMWRITSETAGGNSPQTANWERADTGGFGLLGSGLSESSGVFTFPSTGFWYINLTIMARHNSDSSAIWARIDHTSNNGGSWAHYAVGSGNINYVSGTWWYGGASCQHMFDITDTSNQKVRFSLSANDSAIIEANSGQQVSGFVALRLADT